MGNDQTPEVSFEKPTGGMQDSSGVCPFPELSSLHIPDAQVVLIRRLCWLKNGPVEHWLEACSCHEQSAWQAARR